jgi:hypothetical protein
MKKLTLLLLLPSLLLAYQPAHSPDILLVTQPLKSVEPTPQMGLVPAVAIGAVVVGGVAWFGLRIANRIMGIWEKQATNAPPPGVVFTMQDNYDGEESGQ